MTQQIFTHLRSVSYSVDGAQVVNVNTTQTGTEEQNVDVEISASTTNEQLNFAITLANLKSAMLYADNPVALKTNSTGSPQETITLGPGQEIAWQTGDPGSAPFAGNVTTVFATNSSTTTPVNVKIRALSAQ